MAQNGLVPVTAARHGHQYWKRFTSYEFATNRADCAIVLQEAPQIAAAFPIVFRETGEGVEPRAVLSLKDDMPTPFVSQEGRWLATYVPSELRSHPFQAQPLGQNTPDGSTLFQLNVDETSGLLSTNPRDEPFFDLAGILSPALRDVQRYLQTRVAAHETTLELCQTLRAMGLFEPAESHDEITLPSGTLGISPLRLKKLSQAEKLKLLDSGAFLLIHAHQISRCHFAWLARAQQQLAEQNSQQKYTENSDISGFLSAMANAQNDDVLGTGGV
ncbi:SapC family protein [Ruegeria arenilitoris]|uniref:SapC family protein n=1 Tax=Ruegeria arenilitoris TaxID=1173585 RepID=UPI00147B40E3|nr:SapC family protein [Ruegeria arenilitoris]